MTPWSHGRERGKHEYISGFLKNEQELGQKCIPGHFSIFITL